MTADRGTAVVLRQVVFVGLPLRLHARAAEHRDAVLREPALLELRPELTAALPGRLLGLAVHLDTDYAAATQDLAGRRDQALQGGVEHADLALMLPIAAAAVAQELIQLLEEVDQFCADERYLLTPAAAPDVVAFRRWYYTEVTHQLHGAPPRRWAPESAGQTTGLDGASATAAPNGG